MFPGVQQESKEWIALYKIRTIVEQTISHFKTSTFPEEKFGTMPPQRQMSFQPTLPATLQ